MSTLLRTGGPATGVGLRLFRGDAGRRLDRGQVIANASPMHPPFIAIGTLQLALCHEHIVIRTLLLAPCY